MNRKIPTTAPSSLGQSRFPAPLRPEPRAAEPISAGYRTIEVEEDPQLAHLKGKLVAAALEFMEHVGNSAADGAGAEDVCSLDCFDLLPNGSRIVIELAVLPPPTPECEGAQRAEPPPTGLLRLNRN
jgi:hypothetical protein